jgi:hypothetical protein
MELWLAAIAVMVIGVLLTFRGARGRRIDEHPICRKCGFDLVGGKRGMVVCPECGRDLNTRWAVRWGNRRRRRGMVALRLIVLLIGVGGATTLGVIQARGVKWNSYKPVWWLERDLLSKDGATAGAAGKKLVDRMSRPGIDAATERRLVDTVLVVQADPSAPWNGDISSILTTVRNKGLVDDKQLSRFIEQSVSTSIAIQTDLEHAQPIGTTLRVAHDATAQQMGVAVLAALEIEVDGHPVEARMLGAEPQPGEQPRPMPRQVVMPFLNGVIQRAGTMRMSYEFNLVVDMTPGEHAVVVRIRHEALPYDRIDWRTVESATGGAPMMQPVQKDPADIITTWKSDTTIRVNVKKK